MTRVLQPQRDIDREKEGERERDKEREIERKHEEIYTGKHEEIYTGIFDRPVSSTYMVLQICRIRM